MSGFGAGATSGSSPASSSSSQRVPSAPSLPPRDIHGGGACQLRGGFRWGEPAATASIEVEDFGASGRDLAASRLAQSWKVGQTGNADERQYASWCARARGAGFDSA